MGYINSISTHLRPRTLLRFTQPFLNPVPILILVNRVNNLFLVRVTFIVKMVIIPQIFMFQRVMMSKNSWHQHLRHLSDRVLNQILKSCNEKISINESVSFCDACQFGIGVIIR